MTPYLNKFIFCLSLFATLSPCHANTGGGFDFMSFLPIVMIIGVFYFLILKPQQKKMKDHQAVLSQLKRGDRVITNGGIIGVIHRIVDEKECSLEVCENVRIRCVRSMISEVLPRVSHSIDSLEKNERKEPEDK